MKAHQRSKELYERAVKVIPGGVNSPVRAFRAVGGDPVFIQRGEGAYLYDVDGNRYLDCIGSWGPLLLGHAHPDILSAISAQLPHGTTFGAPTELEVQFAEELCEAVPSLQKVRLVSSGTEATMSAIRVARGYTGRDVIVKFEGCYHGHADFLLAKAGSGVATLGLPECAGVPASITANTLTLPYNDVQALHTAFKEHGSAIAGVIVEPVVGNMGCVPPTPGFLEALREVTQRHGALLLFDEVMTGFRLAYGGAQERFGIMPDLTMLGKIAGGGLPLGAFGGRADIMDMVAPVGPVYQAGTLSGNPVAVAAGLATVQTLKARRHVLYERLDAMGSKLSDALRYAAEEAGVPVVVNQIGSMITVFFTDLPAVSNYAQAKTSNTQRFARWFRTLLEEGVYWPPSQFESAFLSDAMSEEDIFRLIEAARVGFHKAREVA
ncbi:MAG TPA: glutamate-1-semialdehyde 2,1-aminomutase [Chthonomonas sp.]|uniref:glutamate-1-semialdehyde 2,1-aminomutase n=1 Tax=Chthonomonas sp. TaxID=2282153 RepID=UPI002B4B5878|nr:glutamate-1-semialdehyde 2,1-aminomutase [Chthonomonas sp.]HLH81029.1 glutamate-1-semialdehyde 2,1-aminomutase [Chthonomonas sp.]